MGLFLTTDRLRLRLPMISDLDSIVEIGNDYDIAKQMVNHPYPYRPDDAEGLICRAQLRATKKEGANFLITASQTSAVIGCCGFVLREDTFSLVYWIGRAYWGQGFATEAAKQVIALAFSDERIQRGTAGWFHDNLQSGRVLSKFGFAPAGMSHRECVARGRKVLCNETELSRAVFECHGVTTADGHPSSHMRLSF